MHMYLYACIYGYINKSSHLPPPAPGKFYGQPKIAKLLARVKSFFIADAHVPTRRESFCLKFPSSE